MLKKLIPFFFVLLWSTGFIGTKYGLPYASVGDFLTLRTLANIIIFFGLLIVFSPAKLTKNQIFHAMVTGILIHGAYLGGVYSAIKLGMPAGLAAIIVGLQPLFTTLLAIALFKSYVSKLQWIALLIGMVGLVMVVATSLNMSGFSLETLLFAFIALIGITVGTLYQKRFCQDQALLPSVYWQYIASLLVFLPITYFGSNEPIQWSFEFIFSLAWLVFALSVVAILLLMYMVKQGDAAKVTAYFYLVPPATAVEAWLLFDEQLAFMTIMGMMLCAFSVYIVTKK